MRALHDFPGQYCEHGLTPRQTQVLELVAKRETLKVIASELSISESAVNQHIKALKASLGVNSLAALAEIYRNLAEAPPVPACRNSASRKSGLCELAENDQQSVPDDAGPVLSFHDSLEYRLASPWEGLAEPMIVPGVLNGTNAKLARATYIVAIALGFSILILVGLGVAQGITAALSQSSYSPVSTN